MERVLIWSIHAISKQMEKQPRLSHNVLSARRKLADIVYRICKSRREIRTSQP